MSFCIITKYYPVTIHKPARLRVSCDPRSTPRKWVSYDHESGSDASAAQAYFDEHFSKYYRRAELPAETSDTRTPVIMVRGTVDDRTDAFIFTPLEG